MDIRLEFVNHSLNVHGNEIVFFQRDGLAPEVPPIAWKIIRRCGHECSHPFVFPSEQVLAIFDAWGNCIASQAVEPDTCIRVERPGSQAARLVSRSECGGRIEVQSAVPQGVIHVFLARGGRAVTPWKTLVPGEAAGFDLDRGLAVVPWDGLREGEPVPAEALTQAASLDLYRVAQAQILMTGGGWGPSASRLRFQLHAVRDWPYFG